MYDYTKKKNGGELGDKIEKCQRNTKFSFDLDMFAVELDLRFIDKEGKHLIWWFYIKSTAYLFQHLY
jgi:hypothetical protein